MNRRFVIGVEGLTKDQERELRDYLASLGAWWHWIENLWFLSSKKEDEAISTEAIRDRITDINAWFKGTWAQD
jgi:hypothetical protein